ncbi:MAG: response regulator, partial [Nitrospiraceae bacterium]|nr:response regulator [Nitrospiraceae bacterium]
MIPPAAISVLVVDDSRVAREFLIHIFSEAGIEVIGALSGGQEAVNFVQSRRPDVITMDIYMPGMDGLEATRRIMEANPVPIVIVSSNWDPAEVDTTFRALDAGALSVVRRPYGIGHPEHAASVQELVRTVRLMSEVKVVRRWSIRNSLAKTGPSDGPVR